jgi:hypothetical protein
MTLRSPSALVNRLLSIMESAETLRLERALPERGHLGPEQLGETDRRSVPAIRLKSSGEDLRAGLLPCRPTPT